MRSWYPLQLIPGTSTGRDPDRGAAAEGDLTRAATRARTIRNPLFYRACGLSELQFSCNLVATSLQPGTGRRSKRGQIRAFPAQGQKYQGKARRRQESRTEAAQRQRGGISTVGRARGLSCSPAGAGIAQRACDPEPGRQLVPGEPAAIRTGATVRSWNRQRAFLFTGTRGGSCSNREPAPEPAAIGTRRSCRG